MNVCSVTVCTVYIDIYVCKCYQVVYVLKLVSAETLECYIKLLTLKIWDLENVVRLKIVRRFLLQDSWNKSVVVCC